MRKRSAACGRSNCQSRRWVKTTTRRPAAASRAIGRHPNHCTLQPRQALPGRRPVPMVASRVTGPFGARAGSSGGGPPVSAQCARRSSRPLPSNLPRLIASGAACARDCSRQTAGAHKRASEKELDLGIAAAKLILSPPGDCVVDCRIEPDQNASTLG
jgi:hypothetical protein